MTNLMHLEDQEHVFSMCLLDRLFFKVTDSKKVENILSVYFFGNYNCWSSGL
jgi:hypothetical protein